MFRPAEIRTWIVMLHDEVTTVYESRNPGGVLTRIYEFTRAEPGALAEPALDAKPIQGGWFERNARWLDRARRERAFERLMFVGLDAHLARVRAELSPATVALIVATRTEDIVSVPPEERRSLVPPAALL